MTFSALHGYRHHDSNLDPHFQDLGHDNPLNAESRELYLLDCDGAEFSRRLEQYMKQMASAFYEQEPSSFMKPTLILAAELSVQKEVWNPTPYPMANCYDENSLTDMFLTGCPTSTGP